MVGPLSCDARQTSKPAAHMPGPAVRRAVWDHYKDLHPDSGGVPPRPPFLAVALSRAHRMLKRFAQLCPRANSIYLAGLVRGTECM